MKNWMMLASLMGVMVAGAEPPPPANAPLPPPTAPGGNVAAAFAQYAKVEQLKAEAIEGALAAARAPDEKSRVIEWKRVDGVERKFNNMLNAGFNGMKLGKEDKQAAQHIFYTEFVNGVREAEAQVQDPAVKEFFAKKRANYERKLNQGQKKPQAKKKAPPKKKHDAKKKQEPKKNPKKEPKKDAKKHDEKKKRK